LKNQFIARKGISNRIFNGFNFRFEIKDHTPLRQDNLAKSPAKLKVDLTISHVLSHLTIFLIFRNRHLKTFTIFTLLHLLPAL